MIEVWLQVYSKHVRARAAVSHEVLIRDVGAQDIALAVGLGIVDSVFAQLGEEHCCGYADLSTSLAGQKQVVADQASGARVGRDIDGGLALIGPSYRRCPLVLVWRWRPLRA